ncbi:MAG: peptide synthase [Verrucomicrobia bacterium]|nr:MAG: peptide synthase [Verrucomicrobiota bacterium]
MAARQPDVLALRVPCGDDGDRIAYLDLTFRELDRETDAWAHHLTARGIHRGTRVLLLVKPGLPLIALCFALFKIGAVPVVIDPGMGLRGFLRCVRRTRPEALVAIPAGIWVARLFRPTFAATTIRITVDPQRRLAAPGQAVPPFEMAPTRADELAAILFTSGSTGAAKGVCYEHGMFEAQVEAIRDTYGIQPGEIDLPMLPIFALFNPALGMTTVVPEINPSRPATVDPARIVKAIRQCGVTNSFGSPVLWRKIGDYCRENGIRLPSLRRILMAGAPVPPGLMRDYREILPENGHVHSPYGATEALPVSTISDEEVLEFAAPLTLVGRGTCVGRPIPSVDVRIIRITDAPIWEWRDSLALPPGEIGEIVVRGPAVTRAYDKLPAANEAAKIVERSGRVWHRMGDTGYLDEDGRLWFCGRKAERVVTRDGVLYTDQCEPVFNQHPHVARTALIGLGIPGQQVPAIVVEPRPEHWPRTPLDRAELAESLRDLGRACPTTRDIQFFFFRKQFPVDVRHNAKIHRLRLATIYAKKRPIRAP